MPDLLWITERTSQADEVEYTVSIEYANEALCAEHTTSAHADKNHNGCDHCSEGQQPGVSGD